MRFVAKYKCGKKIKQVTFDATNRTIALLGLFALRGVSSANILSLKRIKKIKL